MRQVFFWRDIYGDFEMFAPHQEIITRLFQGEHHGLQIEKLNTEAKPPIYSIRLNIRDRLLFTTYRDSLCLLDVVYNHDYDKSRFLRSPKKYLDFVNLSPDRRIDWSAAEPELPSACEVPTYAALDYYQQQFIHLSEAQESVLSTALPAIIVGPAGSGKTSTAFILLTQALKQYEGPIAYVSRSQALVRHLQRMWHETYPEDTRTQFLTYTQLYHSEDDHQQFLDWHEAQPKAGAGTALSAESIWQEFRIRSGFDDEATYCHLGKRQSLVEESQREEICAWYTKYRKYLGDTVSTELSSCTKDLDYGLVVVDEAQDLSFAQLRNLYRGSRSNILFLLGSHQILFDGISRMNFLKELLFLEEKEARVITLPTTFRSAEYVSNFLNALIQLKVTVSGGGSDKYESLLETVPERRGQGQFELRKTTDIDDLCGDNPDVAIITLEHLKAEARERFNSSLVFTVAEIKGLEFHSIILWKLLSDESSKVMARAFVAPSVTTSIHRPKAGHARPEFLPLCDAWITAASRAIERLIWVDDKTHAIENIYQYFASYTATASVTAPMRSEWTEVFARLRDIGAKDQADEVQRKHLPPSDSPSPDAEAALASFKTYLEAKKRASLPALVKELLQADGRHALRQTFIYFLVSHPEGCELLQSFYQKHQKMFNETIPLKIWFQAIEPDVSMLQYLYPRAKSWCIQLMTNLIQKIPQDMFTCDSPHSMLPLLSSDPEGLEFLLMLYRRYPKLIPPVLAYIAPIMPQILEQACQPEQKEMRKKLNSLELRFSLKESKKYAKIAEQALKRSDIWLLGRLLQWGIAEQPIFKLKQNLLHLAASAANLKAIQSLCIPGSNVDAQDEQGHTPLLLAVKNNALDVVKHLVALGANLEQTIDDGATALFFAAGNGNLTMVKYLCDQGANIHHTCSKKENALFATILGNHLHVLQYLHRKGVNINQVSAEGVTPMMFAAAHGLLAFLEYICDYDPDINAIDIDGATALASAAEYGHLEIVEYLLMKGANPSISITYNRLSPFMLAAQSGHLPIVNLFCKQGVDINQTSLDGGTALMIAAQNNHLSIVNYLCDMGALINLKMNNGKTALILAAQKNHASIVKTLHLKGALLNETADDGASALLLSAQLNHFETVEYLCQHGAYTEHKVKEGVTALFIATQQGYLNIVKCLCEHGANVHHRTDRNITLLYLAAQNGDLPMIEYLCKHVDLRTIKEPIDTGASPLLIAVNRGYLPIIEHFCKLGEKWSMTLVDLSEIIRCAHEFGQKAIVKYISSFITLPSFSLSHSGIFRYSEDNDSSATSSPPSP